MTKLIYKLLCYFGKHHGRVHILADRLSYIQFRCERCNKVLIPSVRLMPGHVWNYVYNKYSLDKHGKRKAE